MQQACVYYTYSTVQMMKSLKRELKPSKKLLVGDGEEVGRNTDSERAVIVGVLSTLEHTRGLVAGRSCSLVVDTGMVSHERANSGYLLYREIANHLASVAFGAVTRKQYFN